MTADVRLKCDRVGSARTRKSFPGSGEPKIMITVITGVKCRFPAMVLMVSTKGNIVVSKNYFRDDPQ